MTTLTYLAIAFWLLSGFGVWWACADIEKRMDNAISMFFTILGWPFILMGSITRVLVLHSRDRKRGNKNG